MANTRDPWIWQPPLSSIATLSDDGAQFDAMIDLILDNQGIYLLAQVWQTRFETEGYGSILIPMAGSLTSNQVALYKADTRQLNVNVGIVDLKSITNLPLSWIKCMTSKEPAMLFGFCIVDAEGGHLSRKHVMMHANRLFKAFSRTDGAFQLKIDADQSAFRRERRVRCLGCMQRFARGLKKCLDCNMTHYCSSDCQRKDWPRHKVECCFLQIYTQPSANWPAARARLDSVVDARLSQLGRLAE